MAAGHMNYVRPKTLRRTSRPETSGNQSVTGADAIATSGTVAFVVAVVAVVGALVARGSARTAFRYTLVVCLSIALLAIFVLAVIASSVGA
jgi:fatty acid desaturase